MKDSPFLLICSWMPIIGAWKYVKNSWVLQEKQTQKSTYEQELIELITIKTMRCFQVLKVLFKPHTIKKPKKKKESNSFFLISVMGRTQTFDWLTIQFTPERKPVIYQESIRFYVIKLFRSFFRKVEYSVCDIHFQLSYFFVQKRLFTKEIAKLGETNLTTNPSCKNLLIFLSTKKWNWNGFFFLFFLFFFFFAMIF